MNTGFFMITLSLYLYDPSLHAGLVTNSLPMAQPPPNVECGRAKLFFFHIRKNAVLQKLCGSYAAVNNIHAWTGVDPSVGTNVHTFLVEARSLFLALHANAGNYTSKALPGGWEDFLVSTLNVAWCVGTNAITTLPGTAFLKQHTAKSSFGSASLQREDALRSVTQQHKVVFFFLHAMRHTTCSDWLKFYDE